jgi:K+-sensing histidine kinase KdpD
MGFDDGLDPVEARLRRLVHDLRTPLTIVAGFADLLQRQHETLSPEQRREFIERIQAAANDLRDILDAERDERLAAEEGAALDGDAE